MIDMYCKVQHADLATPCEECRSLKEYSNSRVDHCPFKNNKPVCSKCEVHCYKPEMRERIRQVMRYAGPRMMYTHPVLGILHFLDRFKNVESK